MFNLYWTLGVALVSGVLGLYGGYEFEASRYMTYKEAVAVASKVQAIETKQKEEESKNVTAQISQAYQEDINGIKRYYIKQLQSSKLQYNTHSNPVSILSSTSFGLDEAAHNPILAYQCTETTEQLVNLQNWVKQQQQLK